MAKFADFLQDTELKLLNRNKLRELVDRLCVVKEGNRLALRFEVNLRSSAASDWRCHGGTDCVNRERDLNEQRHALGRVQVSRRRG